MASEITADFSYRDLFDVFLFIRAPLTREKKIGSST